MNCFGAPIFAALQILSTWLYLVIDAGNHILSHVSAVSHRGVYVNHHVTVTEKQMPDAYSTEVRNNAWNWIL